eukprot:GHRR01026302.1.p2 GENE.GHRR01026302.1~~GHRR01026302.1.p2  ORF type:complete len:107 (+),score=41.48 GHRR01026302.1:1659-1979(+)
MSGEPTAWANNVASIFLSPFGLGTSDSSVSAAGTRGDILKATQKKLLPGFPVNVACTNNRSVLLHQQYAAVAAAAAIVRANHALAARQVMVSIAYAAALVNLKAWV